MTAPRAIRGMNDILPEESVRWRQVETAAAELLERYGYGELRLPLVEPTELFRRSIGEVTDIVEKEMYTFRDRNDDSLSLRPEGTAGCVRAAIQQNLLTAPCRLWYGGPMFRYERPQKGRQRQFHQIGAEAFGYATPEIDAELIALSARLWRRLGIAGSLRLELNTIGSGETRARYRHALVAFLEQHRDVLDGDSRRRLDSNPLRILDSKDPGTQALLDDAPAFAAFLDDESAAHFERLGALLDAAGIAFVHNPRLVRGLDYYNKTVFEWVTGELGAQGTVCAGGRYDGLVAQLGGNATPAVGFAMGIERLVLLRDALGVASPGTGPEVYAVAVGDAAQRAALAATERLRDALPALRLQLHAGGGSFKSQLKKADRSGARWALVWGDDEVAAGEVVLKPLRGGEQRRLPVAALPAALSETTTQER